MRKKRLTRLEHLVYNLTKDIKNGIPGYDCGEAEAADQAIEDLKMVVAAAIKAGRRQVFKYVNDNDFKLQHERAIRSYREVKPQQPGERLELGTFLNHPHG
jgi:hypothetical protein